MIPNHGKVAKVGIEKAGEIVYKPGRCHQALSHFADDDDAPRTASHDTLYKSEGRVVQRMMPSSIMSRRFVSDRNSLF